jgi:hypothetical protein
VPLRTIRVDASNTFVFEKVVSPAKGRYARVVGLYWLNFDDPGELIERISGGSVYLMVAMTADKVLRLKPQNLVMGPPT